MKGIEMPRCILLHDHDHDEGDCVYEPMTPTDPLEAAWEALGRDVANHKLTGTGIIAKHRPLIEAATPRPAGVDARVVEAFDLLGGMWSWHEEPDLNDYLHGGGTWWHQAGRLLREVVGRPAQPPASVTGSEEPRA